MTRPIDVRRITLDDCPDATGLVIAIDVVRAFTTAAFAFAAGARSITLASTVEEALALRSAIPGALAMGEVGGLPPAGFDHGNSPSEIEVAPLRGRDLVQRTGMGTQAAVRCRAASTLFAASFVVAGATAAAVAVLRPSAVTLVVTGGWEADEDVACAEYLAALLTGADPEPEPYLSRVRASPTVRGADPRQYPTFDADLERCSRLDAFAFAMRVRREGERLVMRAEQPTANG